MSPLFLLGRALEFPNRELFSSYNGRNDNGEEIQCQFPQEVSGMAYCNGA
jgi:hypothetical protein